MDIKSPYTSIPNNKGIASLKNKFDHYQLKTTSTKIITTSQALIVTVNHVIFNSKFYLQMKDCAVGPMCASLYANIFVSEFKGKYIYFPITNKSVI